MFFILPNDESSLYYPIYCDADQEPLISINFVAILAAMSAEKIKHKLSHPPSSKIIH